MLQVLCPSINKVFLIEYHSLDWLLELLPLLQVKSHVIWKGVILKWVNMFLKEFLLH